MHEHIFIFTVHLKEDRIDYLVVFTGDYNRRVRLGFVRIDHSACADTDNYNVITIIVMNVIWYDDEGMMWA